MSNSEHHDGAGEPHRPFRCTFGPVREKDLVWPPPDEDVDAFTVVQLDAVDVLEEPAPVASARIPSGRTERVDGPVHGAAPPAVSGKSSPAAGATPHRAARPLKPTFGDCRAPGVAPRVRPLVVPAAPKVPPPQPQEALASADGPEHPTDTAAAEPTVATLAPPVSVDPADPETTGASRSAWLAVLFAAACAVVAVFEYRIVVQEKAEARLAIAEAPPLPEGVSPADLAPSVRVAKPGPAAPAPRTPPAPPPVPATAKTAAAEPPPSRQPATAQRPRPLSPGPARPVAPEPGRRAAAEPTRRAAPESLRPVAPPPTPEPRSRPTPPPAVVARAEAPAVRAVPAPSAPARSVAAVTPETPASRPAPVPAPSGPAPEPARAIDAPSARAGVAVATAAIDSDEVDIRSTLSRFRTAYSQLDARAARDVWPSVDARALERAFQSLKSQDLRFDRCSLNINGARAQASCTGRATYVPRIGDQSPRFTAREWAFELKKADEGWTIASARTL
jgi:hypothetical protein